MKTIYIKNLEYLSINLLLNMQNESQARFNAICIVNTSILIIYLPLMLIMMFKKSLIMSQKVLLLIQLMTFISKALSDWMRILVQSD